MKGYQEFLNEANHPLKVSIYYDYGVSQNTIAVWSNFFRKFFGIEPDALNADTFNYDKIHESDLVVIPGGKGYKESLSMTDKDKTDLKKWVSAGGKLLAVCAGAFLVTEADPWSLKMVSLSQDIEKNKHLSNRILNLNFAITDKGKEVFNSVLDEVTIYFHGGPVFFNTGNAEPLLLFNQEVPHDDQIQDYTMNKITRAISSYGNGKIISLSPHLEKTEMFTYLLANGINHLLKT